MGATEQEITLRAKAHEGKINIQTEIPVAEGEAEYLVTIALTPQPTMRVSPLDHLYGVLADTPLPEIDRSSLPESRDFE